MGVKVKTSQKKRLRHDAKSVQTVILIKSLIVRISARILLGAMHTKSIASPPLCPRHRKLRVGMVVASNPRSLRTGMVLAKWLIWLGFFSIWTPTAREDEVAASGQPIQAWSLSIGRIIGWWLSAMVHVYVDWWTWTDTYRYTCVLMLVHYYSHDEWL